MFRDACPNTLRCLGSCRTRWKAGPLRLEWEAGALHLAACVSQNQGSAWVTKSGRSGVTFQPSPLPAASVVLSFLVCEIVAVPALGNGREPVRKVHKGCAPGGRCVTPVRHATSRPPLRPGNQNLCLLQEPQT